MMNDFKPDGPADELDGRNVPQTPREAARTFYSLAELAGFEGRRFLDAVYRCVLKREIDPQGLASFTDLLLSGNRSKAEVVWSVASSPEGRKAGVTVSGLEATERRMRLFQLPLVGSVLRWIALLLNLSNIERQLRANSFRMEAVRESMDEEIRAIGEALQDRFATLRLELDRIHQELSDLAGVPAGIRAKLAEMVEQKQFARRFEDLEEDLSGVRVTLCELDHRKADRSDLGLLNGFELLTRIEAIRREVETVRLQISRKADTQLFVDLNERKSDRHAVTARLEAIEERLGPPPVVAASPYVDPQRD